MSAPAAGQVYLPQGGALKPRKVLAVANGRVLYSTFGLRSRECQMRTWRAWMRRQDAQLAEPAHE